MKVLGDNMNYAVILAAGKGSRMNQSIPKCCVEILHKPMISYIVDSIDNLDLDETICIVGDKRNYIMDLLNDRVSYRVQSRPLGSADAIKALKGIDEEGYCLILNADSPNIDSNLMQQLIKKHIENGNDLTICSCILDNPSGFGRVVRNSSGKITQIVEDRVCDEKKRKIKEINGGIYVCRSSLLLDAVFKIKCNPIANEFFLTDIVEILQDYKIGCLMVDDNTKLLGANNLYELAQLEEKMRLATLQRHMENGVKIEGLNDTYIGADVVIEENCLIAHSKIYGNSIIHKNSKIDDSFINNSIIFDDSSIFKSVIDSSIIGKKCMVGPFSHIRNHSMICGNNRVGNFVEIKKSNVGVDTKLSHLAYMGDTLCGSNVNFGCGSITVNYDGKKKNQTTIGDNVFIGCNSNLIAPIHIDDHSFVAAGSTITENLNPGDFAIARSSQVTKKGYAKRYEE